MFLKNLIKIKIKKGFERLINLIIFLPVIIGPALYAMNIICIETKSEKIIIISFLKFNLLKSNFKNNGNKIIGKKLNIGKTKKKQVF